jgi:putative glycerol-1-phosphate prenyltransferase
MDAGSGALNPIPLDIVTAVKKEVGLPLIVGGGIRTPEMAEAVCRAGADIIVVGNLLEENPKKLFDIAFAVKSISNATYNNLK